MAKPDVLFRSKLKKANEAMQQGRLAEAKAAYQQICTKVKNDPSLWLNLGFVHGQLGELAEAQQCFQRAAKLNPQSAEAQFNLAKACAELGQLPQALVAYEQAVKLKPSWSQALHDYAFTLQQAGNHPEAVRWYEKLVAHEPNHIDAIANLAAAQQTLGDNDAALANINKALQLAPNHPQTLLFAAKIYRQNGDLEQALTHAQQLRQLMPQHPSAIVTEAQILERKGDWQNAYQLIEPWLKLPLAHPAFATLFASLCKKVDRCKEAAKLLDAATQQPMASRQSHADLFYAAGETYDKLEQYDTAFDRFQKANEIALAGFDREAHHRYIENIIGKFSDDYFCQAPKAGQSERQPLLIVGMPRSGTSLVEQILASHPEVSGGGELPFIDRIARAACDQGEFPSGIEALTTSQLEQMGQSYLDELNKISACSRFVCDKMPQNFFYLGLIAQMFPGAKIIHCQRDVRDTCLSCYFQNFNIGQGYSNDLKDLAHYYNDYLRLMEHWRATLPIEMLDISYEEVVSAPEEQIRRMLDFLGLPWDEKCLRFYDNKRTVATASYDQVRQPLYSRSIGRWKHYEKQLQPLIAALNQ